MTEIQNPKLVQRLRRINYVTEMFRLLEFRIWILFGICCLGFGILVFDKTF